MLKKILQQRQSSPPIAIGTDLVFIPDVEESITHFGQKYLNFIFTKQEQNYCEAKNQHSKIKSYAGRFAVKEALLKILNPSKDEVIPWTTMEICDSSPAHRIIHVNGYAAEMTKKLGFVKFSFSIAHERDYATAVVLAMG